MNSVTTITILLFLGVSSTAANYDDNIAPVFSSTGNAAILVFLDIHRSYYGGTCGDPDWNTFELALNLQWTGSQTNETGVEVYDTCRSYRRVAAILRVRLNSQKPCDNSSTIPVAGVISYSSAEVNDAITSLVDVIHVVIKSSLLSPKASKFEDGRLYVDLPLMSNVEIMTSLLKQLDWTYITTVSADDDIAKSEHEAFLEMAKRDGICVQYSTEVQSWEGVIKTPGVVLFASDWSQVQSLYDVVSDNTPVVVISLERSAAVLQNVHNGLLLSNGYHEDTELSEYLSEDLWNQTAHELTMAYYLSNFNCSFNQTAQQVSCREVDNLRDYFSSRTLSRKMNKFTGVLKTMQQIVSGMMTNNCTDFSQDCLTPDLLANSEMFLGYVNKTLILRPPFEVHVSHVIGGGVQSEKVISVDNLDHIPEQSWLSAFPTSTCSNWCPDCHVSQCSQSQADHVTFSGDYVYYPGDIVIAGMLPASLGWNSSAAVCSGENKNDNINLISEAFLYAIKSAKDRYSNILHNSTVGAFVFDTCSDLNRGVQILTNFESCRYKFRQPKNENLLTPHIVPLYVSMDVSDRRTDLLTQISSIGKMAFGIDSAGGIYDSNGLVYNGNLQNFDMVTTLLAEMEWSYVGLLSSANTRGLNLEELYASARARNICIAYHNRMSKDIVDLRTSAMEVQNSLANTVIIAGSPSDINTFFQYLTTRNVVKTWIILETTDNWFNFDISLLPLGTILFQKQNKHNDKFNDFLKSPTFTLNNPWRDFVYNPSDSWFNTRNMALAHASDVIKTVDISMAVLDEAISAVCGNGSGLCPKFRYEGAAAVIQSVDKVWFAYQNETIKLEEASITYGNYEIMNLLPTGLVEVGRWADGHLVLSKERVRSYNSLNQQLAAVRVSTCYSDVCFCTNINASTDDAGHVEQRGLDPEMGFVDSSAEFQTDLWKIIVIIIAGSGALLSLLLFLFILCKICSGTVLRRYLILAFPMLFSMLFLFLSVIPFAFSPSEEVCGMRYFAHGFSYALCFASLLAKMMSLRDYKLVGLGGTISRLNQMLGILFMIAVQIAVGVQWWVLRTPVVHTETLLEQSQGRMEEKTYYACDFNRADFVSYHAYVIVLLILCCLYSFSIRHDVKESKEISTRVLIVCAWFCLVLWVAIIVTLFVLPREFLEAICAVGLLANAMAVLLIIFLPTVTAISRLKYDVADQAARKENGYKLDPDFQFERPYSLPGTLAITDKTLTYPRSLATFDTSLSY